MTPFMTRRHILEMVGGFLSVVLVAAGIWFVVRGSDNGTGTGQPPGGSTPTVSPTETASAPVTTAPATMTVKVYFHKGPGADPTKLAAVTRTVPRSPAVATAALTQLLAGPTSAERQAGYWSLFTSGTAEMLRSVRIGNGVGHADFRDFSHVIPNASSSTGSAVLLSELDATLKQFGTVKTTVYSFYGGVGPFYEWLQLSPPVGMRPTLVDARAVARDFLIRVTGMADPRYVASRFISDALASVDFRPMIAGNVGGPITTVLLSYGAIGFTPRWATTAPIIVDSPSLVLDPADLTPVGSPLSVSGRAQAWEGHVTLRVVQDNGITVRQLGQGFGLGGGDEVRPFTGTVTFNRPTTNSGWLLATDLSGHNGEVKNLTAVPLLFAGAPVQPRVVNLSYRTDPALPEFQSTEPMAGIPTNGWAMPTGQGTITFTIQVSSGTDRVRLYLTPLGTGTTPTPQPLGTATRSGPTTFRYTWHYADQPLLGTITIAATGPAGRGECTAFHVFHS